MKVLMIFVVRYCTTPEDQYGEGKSQLINFTGDESLFFTKELSTNVHLQTGQRYWFPDGKHPFYPGSMMTDDFHDYVVKESGYITLDNRGLPYFVIFEQEWFSGFEPKEIWEESEIDKQMTVEELWQKFITERCKHHRKSFAEFGWKEEKKLPPT